MTINITFRDSPTLFNSEILTKCYRDLFYRSDESLEIVPERGPISALLEDFTIVPAKGGSNKKFREWPDVTYLTHVLNGMTLSGKLLDLRLSKLYTNTEKDKTEVEKFVRLFFASVTMHDADKLFQEGQEGASNLDIVLEKNKQEIIKICAYYLKSLGQPSEWWGDLSFLILKTENRTMDLGNSISTKMRRSELSTISQYTKLADQLGGIPYDTTDKIFERIKEYASPNVEGGENFHLIRFSDLPQTLLMGKLNDTITSFLRRTSRDFTINFPDGIAFFGKDLQEDEIYKIKQDFSGRLSTNFNQRQLSQHFHPSRCGRF